MPRHSLGKDASDGASVKIEVKVPADLRERIRAILQANETVSSLARSLFEREAERREKQNP